MKKKQTKAQKSNYQKFFPLAIFISILFMSVGYAVINAINLDVSGEALAKSVSGIYITEVSYLSNNNADITNSKIITAYGTMLNSEVALSKTDATSTITYQIKFYNSRNYAYKLDDVTYVNSSDTYSNTGITYKVNELDNEPVINSKDYLTITLTFSYVDQVLATSNILTSYLNFNFSVVQSAVGTYDYTGDYQTFTALENGVYKLETWGAQGGTYDKYIGGYGTYSTGEITLNKGDIIYIYVGGQGGSTNIYNGTVSGGYNGGGSAVGWWSSTNINQEIKQSGGGATHIATSNNYIHNLTKDKLLIISAGGSGAIYFNNGARYAYCQGGNAGGIEGGTGECDSDLMESLESYTVPTQSSPGTSTYAGATNKGAYGKGNSGYSGGGGGYYGGAGGYLKSSGGSSYIGNSLLTNKYMVCNNCTESTESDTKTITTNTYSTTATKDTPKSGNGYAKITIISTD